MATAELVLEAPIDALTRRAFVIANVLSGGDPIPWTVRLRYFLSSVLRSSFFFLL